MPSCGAHPYSLVGDQLSLACLMKENRVGADGSLSLHNPIRSSNQVIIVNRTRELYLLATLEHSGLLYFPIEAATRSMITAPLY
jgi:hypothetical protein